MKRNPNRDKNIWSSDGSVLDLCMNLYMNDLSQKSERSGIRFGTDILAVICQINKADTYIG